MKVRIGSTIALLTVGFICSGMRADDYLWDDWDTYETEDFRRGMKELHERELAEERRRDAAERRQEEAENRRRAEERNQGRQTLEEMAAQRREREAREREELERDRFNNKVGNGNGSRPRPKATNNQADRNKQEQEWRERQWYLNQQLERMRLEQQYRLQQEQLARQEAERKRLIREGKRQQRVDKGREISEKNKNRNRQYSSQESIGGFGGQPQSNNSGAAITGAAGDLINNGYNPYNENGSKKSCLDFAKEATGQAFQGNWTVVQAGNRVENAREGDWIRISQNGSMTEHERERRDPLSGQPIRNSNRQTVDIPDGHIVIKVGDTPDGKTIIRHLPGDGRPPLQQTVEIRGNITVYRPISK